MRTPLRAVFMMTLLALFFTACGGQTATTTTAGGNGTATDASPRTTLNVFAAASLTEAFNEIKGQYETTHSSIRITYNFAGSQQLVQQLTNGASADVFASADQSNMQKATDAGLVLTPKVFAKNRLVVIVPTADATVSSLKDLSKPGVKLVMGGPTVPAGKYALQVLDKLGASPDYGKSYEAAVKKDVVSQEDNVKAVVQKVQLGEADAGFVYLSDVTTAVSSKVKMISIPDQYNVIAQYPVAVTKGSTHSADAQAFVDFLLSSQGQVILTKYHFLSIVSNIGGQDQ